MPASRLPPGRALARLAMPSNNNCAGRCNGAPGGPSALMAHAGPAGAAHTDCIPFHPRANTDRQCTHKTCPATTSSTQTAGPGCAGGLEAPGTAWPAAAGRPCRQRQVSAGCAGARHHLAASPLGTCWSCEHASRLALLAWAAATGPSSQLLQLAGRPAALETSFLFLTRASHTC